MAYAASVFRVILYISVVDFDHTWFTQDRKKNEWLFSKFDGNLMKQMYDKIVLSSQDLTLFWDGAFKCDSCKDVTMYIVLLPNKKIETGAKS